MTTDVTGKKVILKSDTDGYLLPFTDNVPSVTTSSNGLMFAEDKKKLDSLELFTDETIYTNDDVSTNLIQDQLNIYNKSTSACLNLISPSSASIYFRKEDSSSNVKKSVGIIEANQNGLFLFHNDTNGSSLSSLEIGGIDSVYVKFDAFNNVINQCLVNNTDSTDETTLACQGWVNSKLQLYSSIENVTSSINTAINNLTQQVENTYLTKTDASTTYATKSEIPIIDTSNLVTTNTIQNITGNKTFDSSTTFFKGNYDYTTGSDYSDGYKDIEFKHISLQDINGVESGFISHHLQTPYNMFEIGVEHNDKRASIQQAIVDNDKTSAIWVNADRFMVLGGGTGAADVATQGFVEKATNKAPQTLYQNITKPSVISSKCTINLADNCTMYSLETDTTRQATVEFNNSPIYSHINPLENNYYSTIRPITFEIYRPAYNVEDNTIWPSTITWLSGSVPKLESGYAGLYAFRSFNGGASWIGNLQCTWQDTIPVITFRFILNSTIFNQAEVDNWIWYYENSDTQKLILNSVNKYPIVYANYKVKLSGTEISFPITSGSFVNYNFVIYGKNKVTGEIKQFNPSPASGGIQSFTASETITITLS